MFLIREFARLHCYVKFVLHITQVCFVSPLSIVIGTIVSILRPIQGYTPHNVCFHILESEGFYLHD